MVKEINGLNELKEVVNNNKKVLVDIWAVWCGPCKMLSPIVDKVALDIEDVNFYKINIDEADLVSEKYQIVSIPTILYFENGELKNTSIGFKTKDELKEMIG